MRKHNDLLHPAKIRNRAHTVARKRWPWVCGDEQGSTYREGYEHGFASGAAYAMKQIRDGKSDAMNGRKS